LEKAPPGEIKLAYLPFEGKNKVLFRTGVALAAEPPQTLPYTLAGQQAVAGGRRVEADTMAGATKEQQPQAAGGSGEAQLVVVSTPAGELVDPKHERRIEGLRGETLLPVEVRSRRPQE
jgi:hypothetical protein